MRQTQSKYLPILLSAAILLLTISAAARTNKSAAAAAVDCYDLYIPLIMHGYSGPAAATAAAGKQSPACHPLFDPDLVDFNGDGFGDLAVGIRSYNKPGVTTLAGAVEIFYGTEAGLTGTSSQFWTQEDIGQVSQIEDWFGQALVAADFNGDGYTDLAIGSPGQDVVGNEKAGQIDVLYGGEAGLTAGDAQTFTQFNIFIAGIANPFDAFGQALGSGDFNGDGYQDLAVGVPGENLESMGLFGVGAVNILYGGDAGLRVDNDLFIQPGLPGVLAAAHDGGEFGASFASADFDGDSFDDLAVGYPLSGFGPADGAGSVQVYMGSEDGLTFQGDMEIRQGFNGVQGDRDLDERFGHALAAADFNSDGAGDLVIGVPQDNVVFLGPEVSDGGSIHILFGDPGAGLVGAGSLFWYQGVPGVDGIPETNERFGSALVAADFNGDDRPDLAVGIPLDTVTEVGQGSVQVFYTGIEGPASLGQETWHQGLIMGQPHFADDFGASLGAADFDKDGDDDLAVGANKDLIEVDGVEYPGAGGVNIIYGSAAGLVSASNGYFHPGQDHYPDPIEDNLNYGYALSR